MRFRDILLASAAAATSVSAAPAVITTFGALTAASAGGIAVTGASISSGDPSGHWQISGGLLSPSSAGDTANLNAGPYALVLNNGQTVAITIAASTYSVRTNAELVTAFAAAGSNTTVKLRDGSYPTLWAPNSITKTNVTITCDTARAAVLGKFQPDTVTGVTLSGLKFWYDNSGGPDYALPLAIDRPVVHCLNCTLTFDNCEITADTGTSANWLARYLLLEKRLEGIRSTGSNITFTNGEIHHCRTCVKGTSTTTGTLTYTGNTFHHYYEDGVQEDNHTLVLTGNTFHTPEGIPAHRFRYSSLVGTPAPGDLFSLGSGTSQKVLRIINVNTGSAYVDAAYNNYASFASNGSETVTCAATGAHFVIDSEDSSQATGYDGTHPDVCQPINDRATGARALTIKFNVVLRLNPYVFSDIGEPNSQGFFIENAKGNLGPSGNVSFDWGTIILEGNVFPGGSGNAMWVDGSPALTLINNTILQPEYNSGGLSKIGIANCTGTVYGNVGDAGSGAVFNNAGGNTLDTNDYDNDDNGGLNLPRASIVAAFAAAYAYPQTLTTTYKPGVGSTPDTAKCGALLNDGTYRPTALPPPPATIGISEGSPTYLANGANFTAAAGSNRFVLVAVKFGYIAGTSTGDTAVSGCTFGGVAMTKIDEKGAQAGTTNVFEGIALFYLAEASIPGGANAISATVGGTTSYVLVAAVTVVNAPNAPAGTAKQGGTFTASAASANVSGQAADFAVGLLLWSSASAGVIDFAAGLTKKGSADQTSTDTIVIGTGTMSGSSLTCTGNPATNRQAIIVTRFRP